ncbi:hypothetical protein BDY21DRAFT_357552 [Lineolata rhizophorae]|uniref:Uncharacterized protein n=1 Tax=Lineolata rhizophorae TaxID=578093 RepID=A0A6A6NNM5_9PEZI|nr:hypothetical protein BDY21DRAFT_357552 [Lineolata rhizophorae]
MAPVRIEGEGEGGRAAWFDRKVQRVTRPAGVEGRIRLRKGQLSSSDSGRNRGARGRRARRAGGGAGRAAQSAAGAEPVVSTAARQLQGAGREAATPQRASNGDGGARDHATGGPPALCARILRCDTADSAQTGRNWRRGRAARPADEPADGFCVRPAGESSASLSLRCPSGGGNDDGP